MPAEPNEHAAIGITAAGAYVPTRRIERRTIAQAHAWAAPDAPGRASGQRAFANWDEDSITMAVEAVRNAVPPGERSAVRRLLLASTTLPFADRHNAGVLAAALSLPDALHSLDIGGCQRAGTSALRLALETADHGSSVVVAAERGTAKPGSSQELAGGDAAAAITVGHGNPIARFLGARSLACDFVDHFRETGAHYDYFWEERWVRDEGWLKIIPAALSGALSDAGIAPANVRHLIVPVPDAKAAQAIARAAGIAPQALGDNLQSCVGATGAAHSLLLLVRTLENAKPDDVIAVCGFGQGCDVLLFSATQAIRRWRPTISLDALIARGHTEESYLKFLSFRSPLQFEWGMRAELDRKSALTAQYRNNRTLTGFIAGRCPRTGTVRFPNAGHIPDGGSGDEIEDCPLADEPAHVVSHAADWLAFSPSPPARYGHVQFDIGARLMMEFADDATVAIGTPLRMVFRIKDSDGARGYRRYFWKAVPLPSHLSAANTQ